MNSTASLIENGTFNFEDYEVPTTRGLSDMDFNMDSSSWMGDAFSSFNNSLSSVGKLTGGIASLAQIGLGFKALGLAEDELDIKKDQWATSKKEIAHLNKTRKRITNSYMGASQTPTSALA